MPFEALRHFILEGRIRYLQYSTHPLLSLDMLLVEAKPYITGRYTQ